jgi:DNA-binding HxlR family transcriptional regulator
MPSSPEPRDCSIARTLQVIGEKWAILAVREIMFGNRRFEEIRFHTGAPRDILTARLRKLEDDGIVVRSKYSDQPQRYEYQLTELGWSLTPVLVALRTWGDAHLATDGHLPATFEHQCGATLRAEVVCAECGEPVRAGEMRQRETSRAERTAPHG